MASLYAVSKRPLSLYKDRRFDGNSVQREQRLLESTTLYVGNLSFYTTEEQVFDLFSKVGEIKRIIMGLDRIKKTPCGFCFVEYFTREDAEKSVQFLCDTKLDERTIRVDYDVGFKEGRQYGRGRSGGQVRDEHRVDYDPGRGGYGKVNNTSMTGNEMWGNHEPERPFHAMNQPPPPPQYGPPFGGRHPPPYGNYPPPPFHEGGPLLTSCIAGVGAVGVGVGVVVAAAQAALPLRYASAEVFQWRRTSARRTSPTSLRTASLWQAISRGHVSFRWPSGYEYAEETSSRG